MDITNLLEPIGDASPSGIELRNEAGFHAIERLIEIAGRQYRLNSDGTLNDAAPSVEWDTVLNNALSLARQGRDLRLLSIVVRALYAKQGFEGLAAGLVLLRDTLSTYWDSLFPALRGRDSPVTAALPRINALRQLDNDDNGLLGDIKFSVVLSPRGLGPITGDELAMATLSDFEMLNRAASGLGQGEKDALLAAHAQRVNRVRAASRQLAAEEPERAQALIAGLRDCEAGVAELIAKLSEKAGYGEGAGLSLPELSETLAMIRESFEAAVTKTSDVATTQLPAQPEPRLAPPAADGSVVDVENYGEVRDIASRADVEHALDRIVAFYERTEPSSPIPHLARRIRRMVAMDFLELMEEIAPSGLKEFRGIAGVAETRKK